METEQLHADASEACLHRDLKEFLAFFQSLSPSEDTIQIQLSLQIN
jgi:hypothetical protein